jgi:hypothetical protein
MFFSARSVISFGFFLRLLVAIWNGFFGPSPGARGDSMGMHLMAKDFPEGLQWNYFTGAKNYIYSLSKIYEITGSSLFIGCLLSCIAWAMSAIVLLKGMKILSISKPYQSRALLVYALLPSSIFFTALTLREPYQLLLVNLGIYAALKISFDKSYKYWFVLIGSSLGMGLLHQGLFTFGFFIIFSTLVLLARRKSKGFSFVRFVTIVPFIGLVIALGGHQFSNYSIMGGFAESGKITDAVNRYRNKGAEIEGRAKYVERKEIRGIKDLVLSSPKIFLSYLFEPMPWRKLNALDFGVFVENILRGWLIWTAFRGIRKLPAREKSFVIFILVSYLLLELIWSMGTVNWGTALRHHIPSFGLLVIAAFASLGRRVIRVRQELQIVSKVT